MINNVFEFFKFLAVVEILLNPQGVIFLRSKFSIDSIIALLTSRDAAFCLQAEFLNEKLTSAFLKHYDRCSDQKRVISLVLFIRSTRCFWLTRLANEESELVSAISPQVRVGSRSHQRLNEQ